jgi:hypothetical protein
MKDVLKGIGIFIVSFAVIVGILFACGVVDLNFESYFGTKHADNQRKIFKGSQSYIEGMANDLAKYKYELTTEKDKTARKAIIDLIIDKYSDFDENKLESESLKQFLIDIRNGSIQ